MQRKGIRIVSLFSGYVLNIFSQKEGIQGVYSTKRYAFRIPKKGIRQVSLFAARLFSHYLSLVQRKKEYNTPFVFFLFFLQFLETLFFINFQFFHKFFSPFILLFFLLFCFFSQRKGQACFVPTARRHNAKKYALLLEQSKVGC